jgi:hypothetical protein
MVTRPKVLKIKVVINKRLGSAIAVNIPGEY